MGFSRQEYWSGLPCPPPGDLPNPGIEPGSPALQGDSLLSEALVKHPPGPQQRVQQDTHRIRLPAGDLRTEPQSQQWGLRTQLSASLPKDEAAFKAMLARSSGQQGEHV